MPTGTDWFNRMSTAVRKRELALNGLSRWEKKVADAEAVINTLTAERETSETLPAPSVLAEEADTSLPADLRPVFGATTN